MIIWFRAMRIHQWTKNLLVLAGLIFTGGWHDKQNWEHVGLAFLSLCLLSSAGYLGNDLKDLAQDRLHPEKRLRPIAAGQISKNAAFFAAMACFYAGVLILHWLPHAVMVPVGLLVCSLLAYNVFVKAVAVADVFLIAINFVLRAAVGAAAISVPISGWLLMCTGALALMLGFGKRRAELATSPSAETRCSLGQYSVKSLDALVTVSASCAALCYAVYAIESQTAKAHPDLILTTPFVLYGICRYLLIVFGSNDAEEPDRLLYRDPQILISVIGFLGAAIYGMMSQA